MKNDVLTPQHILSRSLRPLLQPCINQKQVCVLEVFHPRCVCENWKGYVVKH